MILQKERCWWERGTMASGADAGGGRALTWHGVQWE